MLDNIIEEHMAHLKNNGYNEISLGSADRVGKLAYDLRCHLNKAVSEMLSDSLPYDFSLSADAFFNSGRDQCAFELHYQFDTNQVQLNLLRVDVISQGFRLPISIADGSLPQAEDAFRLFKEQKSRNHKMKINRRHNF